MFSSPSVRLFTANENMDNVVQRKQGDTNHLSRKPFIDRSVNSKTPDINKLAKDKPNIMKDATLMMSLKKSPKSAVGANKLSPGLEDLDAEDFIFSRNNNYDNGDWDYMDKDKILNVIRCYSQIEDLHPSLHVSEPVEIGTIDIDSTIDIDPMFLALPEPYGCEDVCMIEMPTYEDDTFDSPIRTL